MGIDTMMTGKYIKLSWNDIMSCVYKQYGVPTRLYSLGSFHMPEAEKEHIIELNIEDDDATKAGGVE